VTLRQNGVGHDKTCADAILPKGHPYLTYVDVEEKDLPKFTQLTCYSHQNNEKRYALRGTELEVQSGRDGVRRAQGKQVRLQAAGKENSAYCFVWDY